jgi:flagellar protein FlaJ
MNFSALWRKLSGKASSEELSNPKSCQKKELAFNKDLLHVDLFCHLSYMAALATANLTRSQLFEYSSSMPFMSSRYFIQVHTMVQQLNYDYSEACRLVGENTKEAEARDVLLRMANSLASGGSEAEFLAREAEVAGENYGDGYERNVEAMKKWTDAYVSLILSAALVVVVSVVSMLIFPLPTMFITLLTFLMLIVTLAGVWMLYRSGPKEVKTHNLRYSSLEQRLAGKLAKFLIPAAGLAIISVVILNAPLGWAMIGASVLLLPIGILIMRDDGRIDRQDMEISAFLRTTGGIAKAIGTTLTEAITRLDFNALHALRKTAIGLNAALRLGINPDWCWQKFVGETGSDHINRSVRIFWDGCNLGGDPGQVGRQSSNFALKIALLRGKRRMVSSGFSYLAIVMHAAIVALLVGIYEIMGTFAKAMQNVKGFDADSSSAALLALPSFQFFTDGTQLQMVGMMVTAMLVVLTIANASAIKVVAGGHNFKYLFYVSVMGIISGGTLIGLPPLVSSVFSGLGAPAG